jgi:clan AA aspartic protease (TIGR02281 family)
VPLKMDGGTFVVPVQINGTMTLDFVIDSGATDVSVPADVVSTLMRVGAIREPDFIGENTYVLADGSETKSPTFTIRTLRVGNTVLENVKGSVASSQGSLLLGQSFLNRFKGTSKNSRYRSRATRLSSNDSGLFSFRFVDVHSRTVRDWQRNQFFEVHLSRGLSTIPSKNFFSNLVSGHQFDPCCWASNDARADRRSAEAGPRVEKPNQSAVADSRARPRAQDG